MNQQIWVAFILAAAVAVIGAGTMSLRTSSAPLTTADLQADASSAASAILTSGQIPAVGTTWTATVNGKTIAYTVASSDASSITLDATSDSITVSAGARKVQ